MHSALLVTTGISAMALQSGLLCLSLPSSAYLVVLMDAGIRAVPKGQWEAARALGLPGWSRWIDVICRKRSG